MYWDTHTGNELTDSQLEDRFDEYLDECHGPIVLVGIERDASYLLKHADPIGYRSAFNDWLDSQAKDGHLSETDPNTYHYTVPATYYCDGHTPGDVYEVQIVARIDDIYDEWFYVRNIDGGDEFPAKLDELEKI